MTWFRVDDGFPEHPKLEALEADPRRYMAAITVWTIMGADCSRRLTDGYVSRARLEKVLFRLGKAALEGAAALVACELWESVEGGWKYHDWHDYQPRKADVDASRQAKTERQRRWRDGRVDGRVDKRVDASTQRRVDDPRDAAGDAAPVRASPDPSRPDPSRSPLTPQGAGADSEPDPEPDRPPEPGRLRFELEELVRAEFAARDVTSQKASPGQWLDGCKTVQEALGMRLYPDARSAMQAFAGKLVDAVAAKKPPSLGLALQQVQLGEQLRPALAGGRQLSPLALATLERRRAGEGA